MITTFCCIRIKYEQLIFTFHLTELTTKRFIYEDRAKWMASLVSA